MTIDDVFFYGVYLSQILLVSLYVPSRVVRRARNLIGTYPPAEFPKLYPVPVATIERTLRVYRSVNVGVVVVGLALLAADWWSGYTIDSAWWTWQEGEPYPVRNMRGAAWVSTFYTLLQYLLSIALFAYWESRYFKRMRAAARDRIRTAELKARRLFGFVSPVLLGTAAAMYVGVTVSLLFLELPQRGTAIMITCLTMSNVWAAGCLVWVHYRKKHDPHQTHEDRARMIRTVWQSVVVLSILLSALFVIAGALVAFRLQDYMGFVWSLFIQVIAVIGTGKFSLVVPSGQENFEVYRGGTNRATAVTTSK